LEKFAAVQMIDVHLPTNDGRELVLTRYTEPEPELSLLLKKLKLELPPNHHPKSPPAHPRHRPRCSADLRESTSAISDSYILKGARIGEARLMPPAVTLLQAWSSCSGRAEKPTR
jgi:hypothetical protein